MPKTVSDRIPGFAGGLNSVSSAPDLGETQVSEATNARLTPFGAIKKRGGSSMLTTAAIGNGPIQGVIEWTLSSGFRVVIVVSGGAVYRATYGTFPMTFSAISGSVATSGPVSMVAFRDADGDALYIADGGPLNKISVTDIGGPVYTLETDLTSTPSVTRVEVFNQRLWACGSSTYPQSVFYSALNDGDSLGVGADDGGQIVVRTFGQQTLTTIKSVGTSLLLFHEGGISRLTGFGQDDTLVVPAGITGDTGTLSPDSVVRDGGVAYFVNTNGLFVASADAIAPVGTPEKPDPLTLVIPILTGDEMEAVYAVHLPTTNELLIHLPTAGAFVFNLTLRSWSGPWTGAYLNDDRQVFAVATDADGAPVTLRGDSDGFVHEMDARGVYTDESIGVLAPVEMRVTCRRMFFGDFARTCSFRWGYIMADLDSSESSTVSWHTSHTEGSIPLTQTAYNTLGTEDGDTITTEDEDTIAIATAVESIKVPVWGTGSYMDFTIEDDSSTAAPTFAMVHVTGFGMSRR